MRPTAGTTLGPETAKPTDVAHGWAGAFHFHGTPTILPIGGVLRWRSCSAVTSESFVSSGGSVASSKYKRWSSGSERPVTRIAFPTCGSLASFPDLRWRNGGSRGGMGRRIAFGEFVFVGSWRVLFRRNRELGACLRRFAYLRPGGPLGNARSSATASE